MTQRETTQSTENEEKVKNALEPLQKGTHDNPHAAARAFDAPVQTIYDRFIGGKSRSQARAGLQKIFIEEEEFLVA